MTDRFGLSTHHPYPISTIEEKTVVHQIHQIIAFDPSLAQAITNLLRPLPSPSNLSTSPLPTPPRLPTHPHPISKPPLPLTQKVLHLPSNSLIAHNRNPNSTKLLLPEPPCQPRRWTFHHVSLLTSCPHLLTSVLSSPPTLYKLFTPLQTSGTTRYGDWRCQKRTSKQ